jgi:GTP cyclohydrolase I
MNPDEFVMVRRVGNGVKGPHARGAILMDAVVKPAGSGSAGMLEPLARPSREEAEAAVRTLILWAGDDPRREGLVDTPRRVARAWREMFSGYEQDPAAELGTVFEEVGGYGDIVVVRDIPFFSHCEHHVVPILGKAHVGYYPREGVVGLSKFARVIDIFARRLQTQENLTAEIVNTIDDTLRPRGLAVMLEAEHMCMAMRGIQKQGVSTITTGFSGVFKDDPTEQVRFMTLVRGAR